MEKVILGIITLGLIIFFTCNNGYADKVRIPFSCFPKELSVQFKEAGLSVDVKAEDRTKDSWGFIKSEGNEYTIFTYDTVSTEELELIKQVAFEHEMRD